MTRARVIKRLKLAALAVLGLCSVSIPVTIALVLSSTGASDVLSLGPGAQPSATAVPTASPVVAKRCRATRGYYALTFDDGPFPATTRRLVAALRDAGAIATFFDVGERAVAHPDLVALQRSAGQLANHGYTHVRLTQVSQARRLQELQAAARALVFPNAFFRPPFGETDAAVDADVRRSGLRAVYWTVDTQDQSRSSAEIIAAAATVEPGGIILLHDGYEPTVRAVGPIVRRLRAAGLCPGVLSPTTRTIAAANGARFNVWAAKP